MNQKSKSNKAFEGRKKSIIWLFVSLFILAVVLLSIKVEFSNPALQRMKGTFSVVLLYWSLITIVRSFAGISSSSVKETESTADITEHEIGNITSPRMRKKKNNLIPTTISVNAVISLLADNDIIEFEVAKEETSIFLGSSSDCEPGSSVFFDKLYYIETKAYTDLDNMIEALNDLFPDGEIPVLLIDGVSPKHYRIPNV